MFGISKNSDSTSKLFVLNAVRCSMAVLISLILACDMCENAFAYEAQWNDGNRNYTSEKPFVACDESDSFNMLVLSDAGRLYTWGRVQYMSLYRDNKDILYTNGNWFDKGESKRETFDDTAVAIAENVREYGYFHSFDKVGGSEFQVVYYLTNDNRLYFLYYNTAKLMAENVLAVSRIGVSGLEIVNADGEIFSIKNYEGTSKEWYFEPVKKIMLHGKGIKHFYTYLEWQGELPEWPEDLKVKVLFDDGGYWEYTDDGESLVYDDIEEFTDSYYYVLTKDGSLLFRGEDPVSGENAVDWREVADDVKAYDIIGIYDEKEDPSARAYEYILAVLKNDGTLWVRGRNDLLKLGTENQISTDALVKADEDVRAYSIEVPYMGKPAVNYILKNDGSLWANGYFAGKGHDKSNFESEEQFREEASKSEYRQIAENIKKINSYGSYFPRMHSDVYNGYIAVNADNSMDVVGRTYFGYKLPSYTEEPIRMLADFSDTGKFDNEILAKVITESTTEESPGEPQNKNAQGDNTPTMAGMAAVTLGSIGYALYIKRKYSQ